MREEINMSWLKSVVKSLLSKKSASPFSPATLQALAENKRLSAEFQRAIDKYKHG